MNKTFFFRYSLVSFSTFYEFVTFFLCVLYTLTPVMHILSVIHAFRMDIKEISKNSMSCFFLVLRLVASIIHLCHIKWHSYLEFNWSKYFWNKTLNVNSRHQKYPEIMQPDKCIDYIHFYYISWCLECRFLFVSIHRIQVQSTNRTQVQNGFFNFFCARQKCLINSGKCVFLTQYLIT